MTLTEIVPAVRALPNPDKVRLLQLLADDLAVTFEPVSGDVAVWSPFDAYAAAQALDDALRADGGRP